jgi:hypothetical protein
VTDLSPAAQAVLDACDQAFNQCGTTAQGLSAALKAAADQVVPEEDAMPLNLAHRLRWDALQSVRYQLLAIVADLGAHP